jgi:uncharacterized membrane protein (DUF4010 family)
VNLSSFLQDPQIAQLPVFVTSLAIGLLIGLERERSPYAKAGLRTFALVSLFGTITAMLSQKADMPWLLVAGLASVAVLIVAAYFGSANQHAEDPGTTTEAALLVCFGLGAMVWYGNETLAIMLAITTTILLYFKPELHGWSQRLTRRDLVSILQFGVLTFIVLPILPDENFGPFDALNPHQIWIMVVLISGISLAGYMALRMLGQRYGTILLGLLGGLVSSTATTLVYAKHSKAEPAMSPLAVSVILLANLVVMVRLAVLGLVLAPQILSSLLPVLGAALLAGIAVIMIQWHALRAEGMLPQPEIANPTEIRTALGFGILYAAVLFLAAWLTDYAGRQGLYAVAAVSGLTDVDPITLSSLRLLELGRMIPQEVVTAIVIALAANYMFKLGIVFFVSGRRMGLRCLPGMMGPALGAVLGLYFF